jgi:hypothetical protein
MARVRAGKTVKVSVSLDRADLAILKRRAKELHRGNLSAVFGEAARLIAQRDARLRLIDLLGGPTLTADSAAAIDVEQESGRRYQQRKVRRRRVA